MDLSYPIGFLFFIKKGKAKIGKGTIRSHNRYKKDSPKEGTLILQRIKWMDLMGISLPLPEITFDLYTDLKHEKNQTLTNGKIYLFDNLENKQGGISFSFPIVWKEYRLPMDLGIQKLIEKIFDTIQPSLIEKGLIRIGKEVFDRIKKTP